jgi:nucleoside-triphosphatase THEP1
MLPAHDKKPALQSIILWAGPKHSGKTTSAARLVQAVRDHGFIVAGCLAPSVYAGDVLLGFDLVDLRTGRRAPLMRREIEHQQDRSFHFLADGVSLGEEALGPTATKDADLIIVDEYGPWELKSQLWRRATDRLAGANDYSPLRPSTRRGAARADAVLLLVVREELVDEVLRLYAGSATKRLAALAPESVDEVLALLESRCRSSSPSSEAHEPATGSVPDPQAGRSRER